MFKSLRTKIFLSFLLLVLLLVTAGVMSIMEFDKLGNSVSDVLKNNYQSVESAKSMLNALERQESGILMWMLGEKEESEKTIHASDSVMQIAILSAQANITEHNEDSYVADIIESYNKYNSGVTDILKSNGDAKLKYTNEISMDFADTRNAIYALMAINQDNIYNQSNKIIDDTQRAMMPAVVSIIGAIIFAVILNFFISLYFINPLKRLVKGVRGYYAEQGLLDCGITSDDEIKKLEDEINKLITRMPQNGINEE